MIKHIKQVKDNECGVAAYATVTRISLEESRLIWEPYRTQPNGWIKHSDMRDRLVEAGYLDTNCQYSTKLDISKGNAIVYCRNEMPQTSKKGKSTDDNSDNWRHYVPFIDGLFYDPHDAQPSEQLKPNLKPSIIYYLNT